MHKAGIADEIRERLRRGGVFEGLIPRQTAHIVIDLQNGFMGEGQVMEVPMARTIVPNVNRISAALRAGAGSVVFTQHTVDDEASRTWPIFFEHFCGRKRRTSYIEAFTAGSQGHALWPELDVAHEDLVILKSRFGAFVPGSSDLHVRLQERGIDTLIISGTLSHVCCDATARDAMMMNYKVFFITDANATTTDAEHGATLTGLASAFCDVRDTQSILALITTA